MEYAEICVIAFIAGVATLLVLLLSLLKPRRKIQKESLLMRISEWFFILIAMATISIVVIVWMLTWS